jgi:hypothetical protein
MKRLLEYIEAGLRLIGWKTTRYVWIPGMGIQEVDRCLVDGGLVLSTQASLRCHPGHRMQQPCKIGIFELLWLWIIRK